MDRVTPQVRSRIMSLVKSRNGKTTERRLRALLVGNGFRGWQMNCPYLPGKPDFVFPHERCVIFVDGCFWHGCACKRPSKTRRTFWLDKIKVNKKRDLSISRKLQNQGWSVLRVKECALKTDDGLASTLRRIEMLVR